MPYLQNETLQQKSTCQKSRKAYIVASYTQLSLRAELRHATTRVVTDRQTDKQTDKHTATTVTFATHAHRGLQMLKPQCGRILRKKQVYTSIQGHSKEKVTTGIGHNYCWHGLWLQGWCKKERRQNYYSLIFHEILRVYKIQSVNLIELTWLNLERRWLSLQPSCAYLQRHRRTTIPGTADDQNTFSIITRKQNCANEVIIDNHQVVPWQSMVQRMDVL